MKKIHFLSLPITFFFFQIVDYMRFLYGHIDYFCKYWPIPFLAFIVVAYLLAHRSCLSTSHIFELYVLNTLCRGTELFIYNCLFPKSYFMNKFSYIVICSNFHYSITKPPQNYNFLIGIETIAANASFLLMHFYFVNQKAFLNLLSCIVPIT